MKNKKLWKKSDLISLGIQEKDIEYLSVNGIEVGSFGCIEVYPEFENNKGIVLGYDSDIPIVCYTDGDGIYSIEEELKRFVNSSVEQFVLTINKFSLYCKLVEGVEDEEEALSIVNSTINEMKKVDAQAWFNEINYWPIIGQQMIEGNL